MRKFVWLCLFLITFSFLLFLPIQKVYATPTKTITYNASTNVITVSDSNASNPFNCNDLWNADKSGTYDLLSTDFHGIESHNLTNQLRPSDNKGLRLKLAVGLCFQHISFLAGNLTVYGQDIDEGSQSEFIDIPSIGNYYTEEWYSSIDNITSGGGGFHLIVKQEQWGVVWKIEDAQYRFDASIETLSGIVTYINFTDVQIYFSELVTDWRVIILNNKGYLTLGQLDDSTNHITSHGVSIISNNTNSGSLIIRAQSSGAKVWVYDSKFTHVGYETGGFPFSFGVESRTATAYVWNSFFDGCGLTTGGSGTFDVFNVRITNSLWGASPITGTFEKFYIDGVKYGLQFTYATALNIQDASFKETTSYTFQATNITTDKYLINVESDDWDFYWYLTSTAEVYRQYEFDLTMFFQDGSQSQNANVTISNDYLGTSNSWLTFANGSIPSQTYSYGHYNQTGGDTIYDYNPYNLTVTLDGYETYTDLINITQKEDLRIALTPSSEDEQGFQSSYYLVGSLSTLPLLLLGGIILLRRRKKNGS